MNINQIIYTSLLECFTTNIQDAVSDFLRLEIYLLIICSVVVGEYFNQLFKLRYGKILMSKLISYFSTIDMPILTCNDLI